MATFKLLLAAALFGMFAANNKPVLKIDDQPKLVGLFTSALKNQSDTDIRKCLPTREEFVYLIELTLKKDPDKDIPPIDTIMLHFPDAAVENLHRILKRGSKMGIDWKSIRVTNVAFKKEKSEVEGVEQADILLSYFDGHKNFSIQLIDCMKIKEEWRALDRFFLKEE